ncbi:MAG: ThuA domain-containing protein [Owenweeksia sp.]
MKFTGTLLFAFSIHLLLAQPNFRILHYAETSGFDHNTRQNSLAMLQNMGGKNNFAVDDDQTGDAFNTLTGLLQYAAVVFANTTGDAILDSLQRANLEDYVAQGGSLIGIHSASDTYRHSTANGSNTGTWDWYAETMGASVQANPHHVTGTPTYEMTVTGSHETTRHVPSPWVKAEEYYYWGNGYYNTKNIALLKVEATVGPNGQTNPYDSIRPMAWYRVLPDSGAVFYTALGHANSNYTSDTAFYNLIRDAILWISSRSGLGSKELDRKLFESYPIPVETELILENLPRDWMSVEIRNSAGVRVMFIDKYDQDLRVIDVSHLGSGNYFLIITSPHKIKRIQFVKE